MRASALSPQLVGILAMSAAGVVFSAHDALTKYLSASYPLGEIIFFRQLVSIVLLTTYVYFTTGLYGLKTSSWGKQTTRSLLFVASTFLIGTSVSVLPLATALSIVFASPLLVAALSATLLGEPVGPRRWTAIIAGFIGVLIIIRPGGASFSWLLLIPVAAASASALRDITTRILHRTDNTNAILFWSNVAILLATACSMPYGWKEVATPDIGFLILAGALNLLAHFLTITALRFGDAALVTPFRYTALVSAALLGYLIWGHVPDQWTVVGAAIIVGAGVYLVVRGSQVKARTADVGNDK
ncbi:MAG: drug/metabolite transporter (DMT)-like permease [Hyphomicrobiaceae bacterium]|jgi:drug/metabolite transporter (DMT)-like permease